MTSGPGPTMFAVTSRSFGGITALQDQTIAVWPIRVQLMVFFCSRVSAVFLKPQGSQGVSAGCRVWSGGAMVLGKLPVPGRPTILITVGQGPIALAVGAGGGSLDIFTLIYPFSSLSPSLWETVQYRLKYCLKGPLNPEQPTNQLSRL